MIYFQSTSYSSAKKSGGYDSKFEAGYGQGLELRKKSGDIKDYETHQKLELIVNNKVVCDYYIDFVVHHNDGMTEYVETKGWMERSWRIKWKLFLALYEDLPNVKISLVCQGKGYKPRLRKKKLTT